MPLPQPIGDLIARFVRNRDAYRSPAYNEAQARRELIDPFFRALGWDVDNEQGLAEAYKDVIHEDAIKIGGASKAPDYCFRIGGTRKFFVEAKKPAVGLETDPEPAYQLRRYAWTSKLPLSILTDFEEFAVYDCRIRPSPSDKASAARVFYCTCDQYPEKWDWIADLFAKDAILKGAFDKYAASTKRKKGTAEVDAEFLKEIERWRELLAQNFALRNPHLTVRDLNFAVQRTIDRIVFLRMCEDRGIEPYGQLQALPNGSAVYARLGELFRRADERYNSGLFYFTPEPGREPPDELTLSLHLDDKVLKDILRDLYYPESPYEFSVLPTEILGQVYEQFLGKVIRLTPGHRAKVEEKPEVRKAGGVYYTPTYIVDYIVKNTVGKLLEGKTPADIGPDVASAPRGRRRPLSRGRGPERPLPHGRGSDRGPRPLRILDPACGSGSFLLGAYQYLLNWHRDWYVAQMQGSGTGDQGSGLAPSPSPPDVAAGLRTGRPRSEPEAPASDAAAGAANSLLATRNSQLFRDRLYQGPGGQWRLTIQEKKRILLNNIYGVDIDPQAVETTKLSLLLKVLEGETAETIGSTLRLFHERALPDLASNIKCGNSLIGPDFYEGQQMTMFDEDERLRINAFDWAAEFPEFLAPQLPSLLGRGQGEGKSATGTRSAGNAAPAPGFDAVIGNPPYVFGEYHDRNAKAYFESTYLVAQRQYDTYWLFVERGLALTRPGGGFSLIVPDALLARDECSQVRRLLVSRGLQRLYHCGPVFSAAVSAVVFVTGGGEAANVVVEVRDGTEPRFLHACSRQRFSREPGFRFLIHADDRESHLLDRLVAQCAPLARIVRISRGEETGKKHMAKSGRIPILVGEDIARYWMKRPSRFIPNVAKPDDLYRSPKIVLVKTGSSCVAGLDTNAHVTMQSVYNIHVTEPRFDPRVVLAVLNSRLVSYYIRKTFTAYKLLFPQLNQVTIEQLPGPMSSKVEFDEHRHRRIVESVQQMLDLHKELAAAKTPAAQTALQRQIDATDRQIDQLVYQLYGLTPEEIQIVEEERRHSETEA